MYMNPPPHERFLLFVQQIEKLRARDAGGEEGDTQELVSALTALALRMPPGLKQFVIIGAVPNSPH